MKTSSQNRVNRLLSLLVFMVLCPGQNIARALDTTIVTQSKAQLHIPWKLLSARLGAVVNEHASDGSANAAPIGARLISVPYDGDAINWNLTSGSITSSVHVDGSDVNAQAATVSISKAHVHVVLDSLSVDQVIQKTISGIVVRVHLTATCGPIEIDQAAAAVGATFGLNWTSGSPLAELSKLDLSWTPGSWTFNAFNCSGPSGTDQLVRDGLTSFLKEPSDLKPYVAQYISVNLQSGIDSVLSKLRTPFAVGSGASAITINVGTLSPASTGVLADLSLKTNSKDAALPALPVPSSLILDDLSDSAPTLVGDKSVIEFIVGVKLASQPKSFKIDLQKIDAFHKLMKSRVEQLFAWQDLWHYSKNSPFYLNLSNPRSVALTRAGTTPTSGLSSPLPVSSVIQSFRDQTWWDYVNTKGTAAATVALSVKAGTLTYATTINTLKVKSEYGDAYRKKYNKGSEPISDSIVEKTISGPQAALSGSMIWPDVDLAEAGKYRATSFAWTEGNTFSLVFTPVTAAAD